MCPRAVRAPRHAAARGALRRATSVDAGGLLALRSSGRALLALSLVLVCPPRVLAQAGNASPVQNNETLRSPGNARRAGQPPSEAVDHYLEGRKWYLAGRYRDALVELKAALELDPRSPDLLYNVARVYENLRLFDESIEYYQRYLAQLPVDSTEEHDKTEKTIRRLQGAKREFEQQQQLAHNRPGTDAAPAPSAGRADLAFWLTGGLACGMLAAGGVTGILALKKTDDVAGFVVGPDGSVAQRTQLVHQADQLALTTDLLLAAGALAFAGAVLLFVLRDGDVTPPAETQPQPELSAYFDGSRAQLLLRGSF